MTPLGEARAESMRRLIRQHKGVLYLSKPIVDQFLDTGWTKDDLSNAIDSLAESGQITIRAGAAAIRLELSDD